MTAPSPATFRELCLSCRRPRSACWCSALTRVPSRTRVVFLQHPREARVPVSTCRMAHLSLPNSELHLGLSAVGNPALEAWAARPGVAVLFPGPTAVEVSALARPPEAVVVVDGTWANARKVVSHCPLLSRLPRVTFSPPRPSQYRIRREPREDYVSTIEAVAYLLEALEEAPGRFQPVLSAFEAMVELQLQHARGNAAGSRHKAARSRNSVRADAFAELKRPGRRLVAVFGEANAWPLDAPARPQGEPELLQLVARRLDGSGHFEELLAPARPLSPVAAAHVELSEVALASARPRAEVLERFAAFVEEGDVLVGWGAFCQELLEREGVRPPFVDVRRLVAQHQGGRPGPVEALATRLGGHIPAGDGRALRRLAALAHVTARAREGALPRTR